MKTKTDINKSAYGCVIHRISSHILYTGSVKRNIWKYLRQCKYEYEYEYAYVNERCSPRWTDDAEFNSFAICVCVVAFLFDLEKKHVYHRNYVLRFCENRNRRKTITFESEMEVHSPRTYNINTVLKYWCYAFRMICRHRRIIPILSLCCLSCHRNIAMV